MAPNRPKRRTAASAAAGIIRSNRASSSMAEQLTLNQRVRGSSPRGLTMKRMPCQGEATGRGQRHVAGIYAWGLGRSVAAVTFACQIGLAACGQPPAGGPARGGEPTVDLTRKPERTVVVAARNEPRSLSSLAPTSGSTSTSFTTWPFNAYLELIDGRGAGRPYLAEGLPQLNTDTWQVFSDGRMETRYGLKANLAWHDGTPLSAEDFAFAWRAYSLPSLGFTAATAPPLNQIEDVVAADERSVIVRWRRPYPGAAVLQEGGNVVGLPPLPRHILGEVLQDGQPDAFANHPYWSSSFVGLGPYRMDKWEPGAFIEGAAFDGYVLGRARIDRLRMVFIADEGTTIANLRSGAVHMAEGNTLTFDQALKLVGEWAPTRAGGMLKTPGSWRSGVFQFRPDLVQPATLLDLRVRKALAHAIDKQSLNDTIWSGEGILTESIFDPGAEYYPAIDRAITKYSYDPRASHQLMGEAGFSRDPQGLFVSPTEGRWSFDVLSSASGRIERAVVAAGFREVGFEAREVDLPVAQAQDREVRSSFPGLHLQSRNAAESATTAGFTSGQVARPETRWAGNNIGGWSSPEYDRLVVAFNETLDPDERVGQRVRLAALLSEHLPALPLYYNLNANVYLATLRGLGPTAHATTGDAGWNIHEWEIQ
ncbi:MAG: hypothetical protein HW416_2594 [Chloroflexi bacterium]|nr:hypothetical protein [Chloroflexota bacterium]